MSQDYSENTETPNNKSVLDTKKNNWWMLVLMPVWVFVCFATSQLIISGLILLLLYFQVPLKSFDQTVLNSTVAAILYIVTLLFVIGLPWFVKKAKTTRNDLGVTRLPTWNDILSAPVGFVAYIIISSILILVATRIIPGFDINQAQNTGFKNMNQQYELFLAFLTLVIIAPVAEEVLFRGYLYGKLKKYVPVWVAIIATSAVFGAFHGAWNLAIDTFALSLVLCVLREKTGSIWSSVLLHMIKNSIAFYILFIYPALLTTLVR